MNTATYQHKEARRMSERAAKMQMTSRGIRIGIATVPQMRIDMTDDAIKLQAALLSKPRSPDWYVCAGCIAAGLFVAVMAIGGWLPGGGL